MRDDDQDLELSERKAPVVTYSRVDKIRAPDTGAADHAGPRLLGVEVPLVEAIEPDEAAGPRSDLRADSREVDELDDRPGRSGLLLLTVGLIAIVAGAGILWKSLGAATSIDVAAAPQQAVQETMGPAAGAGAAAEPVVGSADAIRQVGSAPVVSPPSSSAGAGQEASAEPNRTEARTAKTEGVASKVDNGGDRKPAEASAAPEPRNRPERKTAIATASSQPAAARPKQPAEAQPVREGASGEGGFVTDIEQALADAPADADDGTAAMAEPAPVPIAPSGDAPPTALSEDPPVPAVRDGWGRRVPPADIPEAQYAPDGRSGFGGDEADGTPPDAFPLRHWVVVGVQDGRAIVDGRGRGVFMVEPGSVIPGAGTVESIEWQGDRWVVLTSRGPIVSAAEDGERPL